MERLGGALVLGVLALGACGDAGPQASPPGTRDPGGPVTVQPQTSSSATAEPDGRNLVPAGYDGRYRASATVLEAPGQGPQLCLGAVAESLPPQCGGPVVAGWDWADVEAESAAGTTWGTYTVTGTFDGETFTLTEPATPPEPAHGAPSDPDLTTPCPEPEDGWAPVEPALATQEATQQALALAAATDGYGGAWIDQQVPDEQLTEENSNDPTRYVLNVTTTGDTDELGRRLREVWGGALCVSATERTEAELRRAQEQLADEPDMLSSSTDVVSGTVELGVPVATVERQRELDERYGVGTVRLFGQLRPLDLP